MKGRVHISQTTADALRALGKNQWFYAREELVYAKGKGELQTYWLKVGRKAPEKSRSKPESSFGALTGDGDGEETDWSDSAYDSDDSESDFDSDGLISGLVSEKTARLIDWNVDNLLRLLKDVVVYKQLHGMHQDPSLGSLPIAESKIPLDELTEIIKLNPLERKVTPAEAAAVELDHDVVTQLHDFVTNIAIMYKDHAFHNFEHASHVLLAVTKFMARIDTLSGVGKLVTCDPLAVWACVFSALVHDIDHPGVSNAQFMKENVRLNRLFKHSSISEQNSLELAFGLFMDDNYSALRSALFSSPAELMRFRQMSINLVLATDIMDSRLSTRRCSRWEQVFGMTSSGDVSAQASLVLELLIQAADVSHTVPCSTSRFTRSGMNAFSLRNTRRLLKEGETHTRLTIGTSDKFFSSIKLLCLWPKS
jgi:hypothetical protein